MNYLTSRSVAVHLGLTPARIQRDRLKGWLKPDAWEIAGSGRKHPIYNEDTVEAYRMTLIGAGAIKAGA